MDAASADALIAGRYLVRRALGAGGMADVVAADDLETGEAVAVKLMRTEMADEAFDRRMLQELLATAQVAHPNLVGVMDFGIDARTRRPFLVMELLHGEDLAQRLARQGACAADWMVPLFCDALEGLHAVHGKGIVHKDIKPANLFLDNRPGLAQRLRITDFGIARHMDRAQITQDGGLACTPKYTAPEYLATGVVTPASDVYQMGLVLAEALLGWPMVADGSFPEVMQAHARGDLRLPVGIAGSPVGQVLRRALARQPAERYASASAFAQALRGLDLEAATASIELHAALHRRAMTAR
jgi:serine/threonine protein kinase